MKTEEFQAIRDNLLNTIDQEYKGDHPRAKMERTVAKLALKAVFEIALDLKIISRAIVIMAELEAHKAGIVTDVKED